MSTTASIAERVAAGVAFMDEHDPGWWQPDVERAIDLDALTLSSPSLCILGQRCPLEAIGRYVGARYGQPLGEVYRPQDYGFWALAHELSGTPAPGTEGDDEPWALVIWSARLGLNSSTGNGDEYGDLTAEWVRVITARREALPAVTP